MSKANKLIQYLTQAIVSNFNEEPHRIIFNSDDELTVHLAQLTGSKEYTDGIYGER